MKAYPVRVFVGVVFAAVVWFTPMFGSDGNFPLMYYLIIIGIFMLHQVCAYVRMWSHSCYCLLCVCVLPFIVSRVPPSTDAVAVVVVHTC